MNQGKEATWTALRRKRASFATRPRTPSAACGSALRLRQLGGFRFRRQVPLAGYIADFLCPEAKLVVELDGGQHLERNCMTMRTGHALRAAGYRVLRYWNDDVLLRTDDVLEDILALADAERQQESRHPSPTLPFAARREEARTATATATAIATATLSR